MLSIDRTPRLRSRDLEFIRYLSALRYWHARLDSRHLPGMQDTHDLLHFNNSLIYLLSHFHSICIASAFNHDLAVHHLW